MTPKPKILKKVEELSEHLAEFMDRCDSVSKVMMPSLVDRDKVLFWPDFLVNPGSAEGFEDCTCYYGGETLGCRNNQTQIESGHQVKDLPEKLFPNCIVRKYADVYKAGMKLLEEKE